MIYRNPLQRWNRRTAFLGILPGDPIDETDLDHIEQSARGSGFHNGALVVALCVELRKAWDYAGEGIGVPTYAPCGRREGDF